MTNAGQDWAHRLQEIQPFHVMALLERAKVLESEGRDIIHMEVGEPDFPTPEPIVRAGQEALARGLTQYTAAAGLPELRQAIADFYQQRYGVTLAPQRIIVTPGASGALLLAAALLLNPGDSIMMADPAYPCNRHFMRLVEGRGQLVAATAQAHYQLTPEQIAAHWGPQTRGVLVASPANPTGTVLHLPQLSALARQVEALGGTLIADEIYQGLTYGVDAPSALQVTDQALVINSFSKYFGMTGWRLGWLVAPESALEALTKLAQNLFISPPTLSQYAALAAFEPATIEILEQRRAVFAQRRDFLLPALRDLGIDIPVTPEGAFYLYGDVSRFTDDSYQWCWQLLEQEGVAVTPGLDFGETNARTTVRFAYANDMAQLQRAVERLARFISRG